tara:strand:- start:459 stop:890 length:432 start_codon:yes stop_codon:yes gene_type:complete
MGAGLTIIGFFMGAMLFYLNHRFVAHGPLGKLPLLKYIRKMHLKHHRYDYTPNRNEHLLLPTWAKILFFLVFLIISSISFYFALGIISYVIYYEWMHYRIHNTHMNTLCGTHHRIHHRQSPRHNFSGTMPFIDKIFGTYLKNP